VISSKVKKDSLTGQDVKEGSLGQVPSAANAAHAGSADNSTHASGADSATTAGSATSATNADHLAGKVSSDFVGSGDAAGGALGGPFSNLSIKPNAIGASQVTDNGLTHNDISGFQIFEPTVADSNSGDSVAAQQDLSSGPFLISFICLAGGGGTTTATIKISSNFNWSMDSTAPGGDTNQFDLSSASPKTLMSVGPIAEGTRGGSFAAFVAGGGGVTGNLAISQGTPTPGSCNFLYHAFGNVI
jgi:hypothetical protein